MPAKAQTPKTKAAPKKVATAKPAPRSNSRKVGLNINVPAELHRRFRIVALERDLTLADAVVEAMDRWAGKR